MFYFSFITICPYLALLPSSTHLFAFVAALAVIAIISIGFFTSNLHYKIQILEDQLRTKIGEYNFVQVFKSSLTSKKGTEQTSSACKNGILL